MNILKAQQIGKRYKGATRWAVSNFSAVIRQGEIVALLGESGCGKTTILRLISGFETPDAGELYLHDKPVAGKNTFVEPGQRGVGIVFQDYGLFPHKTVEQNIRFGLFRKSEEEIRSRLREVIELTGLEGLGKRYPHQLSGGQQQRVAVARAIAPNPAILLFDEPFSNIDSKRREQLRSEIRDILKKTGITAVFVTHDTRDVMAIADRVFLLREGVTIQEGTPAEVYQHPRNRYAAEFFGKTNIIAATTTAEGYILPFGKLTTPTPPAKSGQQVTLSIRPDAFEISKQKTPDTITAKIVQTQFFGDYHELTCRISEEQDPLTLTIYASSQHQFPDSKCYFIIRSNGASELEE
jgi:iron(III) transport system ATP-binding protein